MTSATALARPDVLTPLGQETLRRLMRAWFDFDRRLAKVPLLRRLDLGTFSRDDYLTLLRNLRPQVVEGARWISRCASSLDRDHVDIRSVVIGHARDEHRDYEVLEADFQAMGGNIEELRRQPRNVGTEALHAFLMYRAGRANPVALLGAMWIIEGLGEKMASDWAARIEELTGCGASATRFIRYHGNNDESHMDKLYGLLDRTCTNETRANGIVKTAQVTARLYALQLEELDVI
jgi:3-oxoacyl-[acyl-carrier-protein] synthase-3